MAARLQPPGTVRPVLHKCHVLGAEEGDTLQARALCICGWISRWHPTYQQAQHAGQGHVSLKLSQHADDLVRAFYLPNGDTWAWDEGMELARCIQDGRQIFDQRFPRMTAEQMLDTIIEQLHTA